ncbi:MAG: universal stress protein [Syntrophobacteraceae bacterium]
MPTAPNPPKCLLLPIDGTDEALRPIEFVRELYPDFRSVNLILCYFSPPLPPVYSGMAAESPALQNKKKELMQSRQQETRRIFDHARNVLLRAGFSEELIQEHIQQKEMTVARHACLLADIKKVDAILVQKRITSSLEGFLKGESPSALLQHCLTSPIWFTEGEAATGSAVICIMNEEPSLRIADHAGYMLSDTGAKITLLHAAKSVSRPRSCLLDDVKEEFKGWAGSPGELEMMEYLLQAGEILTNYGIDKGRVRISLIPNRGDAAREILSWCRENGAGIVCLGHSKPEGVWSFLKTSVTRNILSEFKNMAVWVMQ